MLRWTVLLCCHLLGACAAFQPPPAPGLFHDDAFGAPSQPIDAKSIFAMSSAMEDVLAARHKSNIGGDPRRELIRTLFKERQQILDYDDSVTRTASEAFETRSGNCLSLVIMTAAFAKAAGMAVHYREVRTSESWSRSGGLYFASGHVNLWLERPNSLSQILEYPGPLVVDFLPAQQAGEMRSQLIDEATVIAMFMNNRAAESLARGAIDDAYWWAREAVRQNTQFTTAYNTLGVVYLRAGHAQWAVPTFRAVLAYEPNNTKVMGNLVSALKAQGRAEEAQQWAHRLAALEPEPPFHFLNAGQVAAAAGDWRAARELFRQELARQSYNPEVHFWAAQASYRLGDLQDADKHLDLARKNSTTPQDTALYAAKLSWLRANGLRQ